MTTDQKPLRASGSFCPGDGHRPADTLTTAYARLTLAKDGPL